LPQAVAKPAIATSAAPPATAILNRLSLTVFTISSYSSGLICCGARQAVRSGRAAP
jgi:hypothetical protein